MTIAIFNLSVNLNAVAIQNVLTFKNVTLYARKTLIVSILIVAVKVFVPILVCVMD